MKERPILFSTPMVQAILEGRKTMTRRIVKTDRFGWDCNTFKFERCCTYNDTRLGMQAFFTDNGELPLLGVKCPYGEPGDRLWVREKFETEHGQVNYYAGNPEVVHNTAYRELTKWKPSIFMPRSASRITLEIKSIRVERLQDISEEDAIREGIEFICSNNGRKLYKDYLLNHGMSYRHPVDSFNSLWESINGPRSWETNPWVWVIEFVRREP